MAKRQARFSKIAPRRCMWIDGEYAKDPLCCGEKVHKHSSWCKAHYERVFLPKRTGAGVRVNYWYS